MRNECLGSTDIKVQIEKKKFVFGCLCPLYNVVMANKNLQKRAMHVQSYCFVYWTYIKGYPPSPKNAAVQNSLGPEGLIGYLRDA